MHCLRETEMFDLIDGLNDREEMLDYLRFLFRNEKELIEDEWFSESEFLEQVYSTVMMLANNLEKEEVLGGPFGDRLLQTSMRSLCSL